MTWRKREIENAIENLEAKQRKLEKRIREQTLEEVAQKIEKLPFGDTAQSFAIFVRDMK
jgi:prefoldin subunit 5